MSFPEESVDGFHGGRFRLIQPKGWGFRAGLDAMLLAASVPPGRTGPAADLGAGTGAVGVALAARGEGLRVTLAERDPLVAAMARRSLGLPANAGFADRLRVAEIDVLASRPAREAAGLADGAFGLVVSNPPFHPPGGRPAADELRQAALAEPEPGALERWIAVGAALLSNGGLFAMIARPENLAAILAGAANRLGDLRILAVHPVEGRPASRILVHARKGSRAALRLLPPLTLRDADGAPREIERLVGAGEAHLDLGLA